MPTNKRVATFATGMGSYTPVIHCSYIPGQSASASADFFQAIGSIPPYVSGILPGRAIGEKPYGALDYGIIRSVQLTPLTTITGGGAGLFATAKLWIYRAGVALATPAASTLFTNSPQTTATAQTPFSLTVDTTASKAFIKVRFGDLLVFEWLQSATTGLALPVSALSIDLI